LELGIDTRGQKTGMMGLPWSNNHLQILNKHWRLKIINSQKKNIIIIFMPVKV